MGKKTNQLPVILVLAGILFLILKVTVNIGVIYPAYEMATHFKEPKWEFQYYTLDLYYGAEYDGVSYVENGTKTVSSIDWSGYRLDIFNDVIGYLLLIAGLLGLRKNWERNSEDIEVDHMTGKRKKVHPTLMLSVGLVTAVIGIISKIVIFLFPFFLGGARLCTAAFALGIAAFFIQILALYALTSAIITRFWECSYRRDRFALLMSWFVIFVLKVIVAVCAWAHVPGMTILYTVILLGALAFYISRIYMRREELVREAAVAEM